MLVRSTAAGERLGGLAPPRARPPQALAAAFDIVVVETVGVGQSETDVADVADTVAVVVQPGAGDALQFLKAGIMEMPDVLVVTKADLGDVARRAPARPARGPALAGGGRHAGRARVLGAAAAAVSKSWWTALDARRAVARPPRPPAARAARGALANFTAEHGEGALRALGGRRSAERWLDGQDPGLDVAALEQALATRLHDVTR